ncbi:peptide deformylase [Mycolicibacterium goodii]|uniref:peptide deformylase n=1 Tax=Mycolicibacterium goodii TaxID=134601 RepID=UPI001BDDB201|nr:peptide deformylase [Mycolicibacterium goodii]MBU8811220.1 peptide deformylase [Mycolicibacterium goodii]MBU8832050.1 peptide deformylase [Mycolicibacterium goodii]
MAVRPIRICGDPVLHRPAETVETRADGSLPTSVEDLVADMYHTLAESRGVGLAAPQVGVGLRIFVYDCPEDRGRPTRHRGVVINPVLEVSQVVRRAAASDDDDEGCLSVPGFKFPIVRADWARVTGIDMSGGEIEIEGTGLFARMLQHETAHLDGVLYVDELDEPYSGQAQQIISDNGWNIAGRSWTPGEVDNPFLR